MLARPVCALPSIILTLSRERCIIEVGYVPSDGGKTGTERLVGDLLAFDFDSGLRGLQGPLTLRKIFIPQVSSVRKNLVSKRRQY